MRHWNLDIYQLAEFGDLMGYGSKDILHPVSCTNTHHDVINLLNHGMVKNTNFKYLKNET